MARTKIKLDDKYWIESDTCQLVLCWRNKAGSKRAKYVHKLFFATLSQLLRAIRELKIKKTILTSYEDLNACLRASDELIKGYCEATDGELLKKIRGE